MMPARLVHIAILQCGETAMAVTVYREDLKYVHGFSWDFKCQKKAVSVF